MDLIIIIIVAILIAIALKIIFNVNVKEVKKIGMQEELNKLTEKYPSNTKICKDILKKLKNENVIIEENKQSSTTLYMALTNKIFISDTQNSFARIQTMAHECLHSIQDKRILIFNFIFSNIYILYYTLILILTIFGVIDNTLLYLNIFLILSMTYYTVRIFLENDAMIKAKYLAKEYMEEKKLSTPEEISKVVEGFTRLNNVGIKLINYQFFLEILIKVIIFSIVALIF